jgi:hypothetical protein
MVWTIVRIIGKTGARSGSGVPGTPAPENLLANGLDDRPNSRVHDKKVKVRRWHKEGRFLIAHAHEGTMKSGSPSTHWLFMGFGGAESAAPWLDGPGGEAPGLMRKSQNFSKSALTG